MKYQPLPIACDCSFTSIAEAGAVVGPAFVYDFHVPEGAQHAARAILRQIMSDTHPHPLAPCINLFLDPDLRMGNWGSYEWFISANGKACGSGLI